LWFHYRKPHLMRFTSPGTDLLAFGTVRMNRGHLQIIHPEIWTWVGKEDSLGFYPVYSSIAGVSPPCCARPSAKPLTISGQHPRSGAGKYHGGARPAPSCRSSCAMFIFLPRIPVPELNHRQTPYHRRLLFDRFFLVMLAIASRRKAAGDQEGFEMDVPAGIQGGPLQVFPFTLTSDQEKACRDILHDLGSGSR
jgi:RecG-like helicase